LIAEGYANKQIAGVLLISMKTVEKHRQGLMNRLNIHNIANLTRYAVSTGVVESNCLFTKSAPSAPVDEQPRLEAAIHEPDRTKKQRKTNGMIF
jgi:hypothetical protein